MVITVCIDVSVLLFFELFFRLFEQQLPFLLLRLTMDSISFLFIGHIDNSRFIGGSSKILTDLLDIRLILNGSVLLLNCILVRVLPFTRLQAKRLINRHQILLLSIRLGLVRL